MIKQIMKHLDGILVVLVLAFIFSSCKENDTAVPGSSSINYSFFVAGHTYGKPGFDNIGVHPPFKDKFDFINNNEFLEFGVFTGDIVLTGTEVNWNEIDSDVALLDHPIYFAAGNHDMTDRILFESRYGQAYRSFIHNSDLIIILDPNLDNWKISGDQLQFLESVLYNNHEHVDNIFVFFHQLLWWEPHNIYKNVVLNSFQGRADTINFWSEVEPLFHSLPNKTYMFAGDVGAFDTGSEFMYHSYDNITFIASGMGGESRDNIVFVDVLDDKTVSFRLIALNGDDMSSLGKLEDYILP
tara:strand:- start:123 stop:1016 length:894 start_codon:yes stop_codon:yes gene_type:complete